MKVFSILVLVLFSIITINASTYYVDQVNGNNNNNGLSESSAWKTITKVNSYAFLPGDNILFRAGQTWREKIYFTKTGTSSSGITIGSYGSGPKPIINGADLVTGFTLYSGSVWSKSITITYPQQLFFNSIRGAKKASLAELTTDKDWYYNSTAKILYIYSQQNPSWYTTPGVEVSNRDYAVYITSDYVTVRDLQVEKTSQSAITISSSAEHITIDNITMYQWTNEENNARAGVLINGPYCSVLNSTFGKNTGNDIDDQNWSGYIAIITLGSNTEIAGNMIYHNSTENENKNGNFSSGIKVSLTRGTTKIHGNYIYHTGSNSIYLSGYSISGDVYEIYGNQIHYPGQAGVACYKTRSSDGIGGIGYVYGNTVTYANRLGGDVGSNGNQSAGIHFNDGVQSGTETAKPYMKWYCYDNSVSNSQSLKLPNGQDSDGIALDFNANRVEVYRNTLYNNYGKGLYIWNADNCKVYYNIFYGNDAGCTVTAQNSGGETTNNNEFYNNTFFKNYNGPDKGPNYNTEIYFGGYGDNNQFRNNIIYASANGFGYYFSTSGSEGCIADNNLVYSEGGLNAQVCYDTQIGRQTFTQWRKNHPQWDANSVNADPLFVNGEAKNFSLAAESPAINSGIAVGLSSDYSGNSIAGIPDIGAFELADNIPPALQAAQILNDNTVEVSFSEKVNVSDLQNPANFTISGGVTINSAAAQPCSTKAVLTTTAHGSGTYTISATNVRDFAGNLISPALSTNTYSFITVPSDTVIRVSAEQGILAGSAALKTQAGSISGQAAYFTNNNGSITFNVNIPKAGNWYLWGRMYYGNTSKNNSFNISSNSINSVLGDDSTKYNRWHYDGYRHSAIALGTLPVGTSVITVTPGEPGETVLLDQVLITLNTNFVPQDEPNVLPVTLISPIAYAVNQPVIIDFKWNKDALAQSYGLEIASDPLFQANVLNFNSVDTVIKVSTLVYSGSYYWRVKSVASGQESDWSETRQFVCKSLLAPVQSNPVSSSINQPLQTTLKWLKNSDAKLYSLQVAEDQNFTTILLTDTAIADTFKSINALSYNKQYFWRVRSIDNQFTSSWSEVWSFTTKSISPSMQLMPVDNSTNQPLTVSLTWNKNTEATSYWLQVAMDAGFESLVVNDNSVADTNKIVSGLLYGTKYYWRIISKAGQSSSIWSSTWSFSCKTLESAAQVAPENNSINQPLELILKWNKNSDATSYSIQVSTNEAFSTFILNENSVTDTFKTISSLQYDNKYYWRIRSTDNQFNSDWSQVWNFTSKSLIAAAQAAPADKSTEQPLNLTFKWNRNTDATSYGLQVSSDELFNTFIINESAVTDTFKTISGLQFGSKYYWRIRSTNGQFNSAWSPAWSFTCKSLTASSLAAPADNSIDQPLQLKLLWNRNTDATSYALQVSTTPAFDSLVINEVSIVDTFKNISALKYSSKYYWRIRSTDNQVNGEWSPAWSFTCKTLLASSQVMPANNSLDQAIQVSLVWNKNSEATSYGLQVATDAEFNSMVINETSITDTFKTTSVLNYGGKYYWRINSKSIDYISDWSSPWNFTCKNLQASAQVMPLNNSINQPLQVSVKWNKNIDAESYGLQISVDSLFATFIVNETSVIDTFKVVSGLNYGQKYYWRVSSKDNGTSSEWSTSWKFTCKTIAELVSPANNIENQSLSITLKWKKSIGENTIYFLQVSTAQDFSSFIVNDTVSVDTTKIISSLNYNTKYFWRVRSVNSISESEWSEIRNFKTMAITELVYPASNTTDIPLDLIITWKKVPAAIKYWLQVSHNEDFSTLFVNDSLLTDTTMAVSSLDYSSKYYWRVKYTSASIISDWSAVWNFTTVSGNALLFSGMNGSLSGDVRLGSMTGMKSTRALYFVGTTGGSSFNINIPQKGRWYLWARMYYMSSGGKNSFLATFNNKAYVLGDDDTKYNKWHWDGYRGASIDLGILKAGNNTLKLSGREPGLTLWIDQFILTNDPNYNPNVSIGKAEEVITDVVEQDIIPVDYDLSQNFPNPFNPSTTIRFALPKEELTTLKIYDILGEEVATLVNDHLSAGMYNINFNAANLASGVYIYQLRAGDYVKTSKMQLLK